MLFVVIGILLIIAGPFMYFRSKNKRENLRENGVRTQASVVEVKYEFVRNTGSEPGRWYYFPILAYTADGTARAVRYGRGTLKPEFPAGAILNIVYDPKAPDTMELEANLANTSNAPAILLMIIFIAVGFLALMMGAVTQLFR